MSTLAYDGLTLVYDGSELTYGTVGLTLVDLSLTAVGPTFLTAAVSPQTGPQSPVGPTVVLLAASGPQVNRPNLSDPAVVSAAAEPAVVRPGSSPRVNRPGAEPTIR